MSPMLPGTSKISQKQAMEILKKKLFNLGAVQYMKEYLGKLSPVKPKEGGTVSNMKSHNQRLKDAMDGKF